MPNRRPRLEMITPSATPEEAAAIAAAIERFMRATAPTLASGDEPQNPWLRAARLEAVAREPMGPSPWGEPHPWH